MKKTLFLCTAVVTLLTACSDGGVFGKERKYTPLYVYHNPLPLMSFIGGEEFPESYYPDFINYPDDRAKHGLRGNVSQVWYVTHGDGGVEYVFDTEGKLRQASTFWDKSRKHLELREFRYNNEGRLAGVYRNPHENKWASSRQKFEYDANGYLVRRKGGMSRAHQTYTYYADGTLKEIIPQYFSDDCFDTKGKMEFDESGNLVKMEARMTSNPFMTGAAGRYDGLPNVCTYTYTDGLCTEKVEKIATQKDTLVCRNLFTYNGKGDLTAWEYSGGIYQTNLENRNQNIFFENAALKVTFEYEYDNHDNWTTMRIILPNDFMKLEYFIRCYDVYLKFIAGQKYQEGQENPILTIRRNIEYHTFSAEEERAMKKKNAPKFTAAQGHGLYGDVRKVSGNKQEMTFDEYGNIISNGHNNYVYSSPTQYMIDSAIGPFHITCEGNIRKEEDEKGIELPTEYEFDKHGRVIRYRYSPGMSPMMKTYTYDGREKHPATMTFVDSYEEGEETIEDEYTYMEFDKQGNWTRRKVKRTVTSTTYEPEKTTTKTEPEFIETRTIIYYD